MKRIIAILFIALFTVSPVLGATCASCKYGSGGNTTNFYNYTFIDNSTADMSWNASYYLRDQSRTLTSEKMKRDVDNDLFSLYGGNSIAGGTGGILSLFGKDKVNPFSVEINVGDGGVANTRVTGWVGGATPRMDMNNYNISSVKDPVTAQDAATKNYVDSRPSGGGDATQYLFLNGTRSMTGDFDVAIHRITNLVSAIVGSDAVNKTYVDNSNTTQSVNNSILRTFVIDTNRTMLNNVSQNYLTAVQDATQDELINTSIRRNVSNYFAPIVGGLVPTVNLGGAGADSTKYLRGDQTWVAPAGGTTIGYTLPVLGLAIAAPVDSTTYYYGGSPKIPETTAGRALIYVPKTGTIKVVEIFAYSSTAGTGETWEMRILNSTSGATSKTNTIQNITTAATARRWTNSSASMRIPVAQGDYFQIQTICPNWATNPLALVFSGNVYIE